MVIHKTICSMNCLLSIYFSLFKYASAYIAYQNIKRCQTGLAFYFIFKEKRSKRFFFRLGLIKGEVLVKGYSQCAIAHEGLLIGSKISL